ncbi:MAG: tyrosine-type recombinase/integrase [Oscillospiraceae bacterium]|nr:tyrosine-type recombinase/integrase [Oscillospiraceae bacterium]
MWTTEEAQRALSLCDDPILLLAMLLALGCSMRIGEILGLTWDCVDISESSTADGTACVLVNKELKRCDKTSLADLQRRGRSDVRFVFPERKQTASSTSLVLKEPKTASSVRKVFLPKRDALAERIARQEQEKALLGEAYQDFNLVLAHEDGRPYEERQIAEKLRSLIHTHNLPPVVFHSLRHNSTSVKLQVSGGNIKAVQGDTGHAQARMVTDLYAHADTEDRRLLAQKVEQSFFQQSKTNSASNSTDELVYCLDDL